MAEKELDPDWKRQLIVRAWREEAFREKLLKDPRAAAADPVKRVPLRAHRFFQLLFEQEYRSVSPLYFS